jgi:V/A-type H+-transporting ATPase subunit D
MLQIRRQVRFLEQGQQMLEKKRDLLTRLIYERLDIYRT